MRIRNFTSLVGALAVAITAACSETPLEPTIVEEFEPGLARAELTTADVHPWGDFATDVGDSRIIRTGNGINVNLSTTGLTPGDAYTVWAVIFNDGDATNDGGAFDAVRFVGGNVADDAGESTFNGRIPANDGGGELFGVLTDPVGAEVHLVVRTHGPKDSAFMPAQIQTFAGGCTPDSSFNIGDGPYTCADVQVAIHPSA